LPLLVFEVTARVKRVVASLMQPAAVYLTPPRKLRRRIRARDRAAQLPTSAAAQLDPAAQVLNQLPRRRQGHGRSFGVPAGVPHPPPARSCRARCLLNGAARWRQRTQHHRFLSRESVAPVSGNDGVPPLPGTTKLSRSFGEQRGPIQCGLTF
jgi:hypothetical protein